MQFEQGFEEGVRGASPNGVGLDAGGDGATGDRGDWMRVSLR